MSESTDERVVEGRISFLRTLRAVHSFRPGTRDAARELLGIPRHKVVRTAISLGYPDEEARRPRSGRGQARKPLGEFVHLERYG